MTHPSPVIRHDSANHRFLTEVDGHEARLNYELEAGVLVITHTGVPQPIGGRGIAAALVKAAFDHARAAGFKVRTACSYSEAWARRHAAEVADLRAP